MFYLNDRFDHALIGVRERLELVNHWNLEEQSCVERLQAITTIEVVEGTSLISIRVRDVDKVDARDIAEEIPASYASYIKERSQRESERYLLELNRAVRAVPMCISPVGEGAMRVTTGVAAGVSVMG